MGKLLKVGTKVQYVGKTYPGYYTNGKMYELAYNSEGNKDYPYFLSCDGIGGFYLRSNLQWKSKRYDVHFKFKKLGKKAKRKSGNK